MGPLTQPLNAALLHAYGLCWTFIDANAAINALFGIDYRLFISHGDCLTRATLNA